jgi:hypothetical protein
MNFDASTGERRDDAPTRTLWIEGSSGYCCARMSGLRGTGLSTGWPNTSE